MNQCVTEQPSSGYLSRSLCVSRRILQAGCCVLRHLFLSLSILLGSGLHTDGFLFAQTQSKVPQAKAGMWYGQMETAARQFRFLIEAGATESADSTSDSAESTSDGGDLQARLVSLDEGGQSFKLDKFVVSDEILQFELKATQATFEGQFDPEQNEWMGSWKQRGAVIPLSFRQVSERPADSADQIWSGQLNAGLQKLELQLRGYRQPDGRIQFFMDSLSQRVGGFKADEPIQSAAEMRLSFSALSASFEGQRQEDDDRLIEGKWIQGQSFDLTLRRVDVPKESAQLKRPQVPQPPFPYEVREVEFPAQDGTIQLKGTLTLPKQSSECPLAILISGSGPQDRNGTIFDHQPFWVIADHLTRNGIGVLRYDERGVGDSEGNFSTATTQDFAADVISALDFLTGIPGVDPKKIGLIGHSEGGIVAPLVATKDPRVSWMVLLAAPAVTGEEILISQGQLLVAAEGGSEKDQQKQRLLQELLFETIKQVDASQDIGQVIDEMVEKAISRWSEKSSTATSASDESTEDEKEIQQLKVVLRAGLIQLHQPWFRYFLSYDPSETLEQVKCPVLGLVGSKDLQVDPNLNLPRIEASLKKAGNSDATLIELSGLNHLFQTCVTGSVSEYQAIQETFSPRALDEMTRWILDRAQ